MDYQSRFTGPEIDERLTKAQSAYQKPEDGITAIDLSEAVQQNLQKANTAYQKPIDGIPAEDIAPGVIPDVSQFITRSVNDLVNYYTKSETYTQAEVRALIAAIQQFHYEVYPTLADITQPSNNVLYLIGPTGTGADLYEEYIWPDAQQGFVKIGGTSIDLSGYVTTQQLNSALAYYTTTEELTILLAGKENASNKVVSWQQTPDDIHYPSEKLVYDSLYKRGVISQTQTWTQAADLGYDYVMSDIVQGDIPRHFVDLWKSRGGETADFNTITGYFEYLDLRDISYNEALQIYAVSPTVFGRSAFANSKMPRAIFPQLGNGGLNGSVDLYSAFLRCGNLESFTFKALYCNEATIAANVATLIYGNTRLKYVGGVIRLQSTSSGGEFANDAWSLETISIHRLAMGINFANSPRLSNESILYMINNETATSAITITLHATAYARAMADADITAALQAHPNVSLASA